MSPPSEEEVMVQQILQTKQQKDMPLASRYFIVFDSKLTAVPLLKYMAGSGGFVRQCHVAHETGEGSLTYTFVAIEYLSSFQAVPSKHRVFRYMPESNTTTYWNTPVLVLAVTEDEKWIAVVRRMGQLLNDESLSQYEEEKWKSFKSGPGASTSTVGDSSATKSLSEQTTDVGLIVQKVRPMTERIDEIVKCSNLYEAHQLASDMSEIMPITTIWMTKKLVDIVRRTQDK